MKQNIHPDYHFVTVEMTDGTTYQTRSTYASEGETIKLEIDSKSHPAWTGGTMKAMETGRVAKFRNKYAAFGSFGAAKGENTQDSQSAGK